MSKIGPQVSNPIAKFVFLAKSALKMQCTKKKISDKSSYKSQYSTFGAKIFLITGLASSLIAQFSLLAKSDLKMSCTNIFSDKSC